MASGRINISIVIFVLICVCSVGPFSFIDLFGHLGSDGSNSEGKHGQLAFMSSKSMPQHSAKIIAQQQTDSKRAKKSQQTQVEGQPHPQREEEEEQTDTNLSIPIIDKQSDDDKIPDDPDVKSPSLECRDSVMEFVINASDQKDECDGLKRAFDAACTNLDAAEKLFAGPPTTTLSSADAQNAVMVAAGQVIPESTEGPVVEDGQIETLPENIVVEHMVHEPQQELQQNNQKSVIPGVRFSIAPTAEDQNGFFVADWLYENTFLGKGKDPSSVTLKDTLDDDGDFTIFSEDDDWENVNQKESAHRRNKSSISLPTSSQHTLGDHMLTDALIMQAGDPIHTIPKVTQSNHHPTSAVALAQSILDSPESVEARTCCASILNVFHEHCDRNKEEEEITDMRLFVIVSVIALCSVVKSLIRHFRIHWLPEAAGCILVGVVLGIILDTVPHVDFSFDGSLFLRVMLPPIVFHAALSIDKHSLYTYVLPIFIYAVVGTLLSSTLIAFMVYVGTAFNFPPVECFLFGALISSIDPIAILSVLQSMGMSNTDSIFVIIFGESLINDGIAIVLYETLIHFLDDSLVIDRIAIADAVLHFIVVMVGSVVVGVGSGMCCTVYFHVMKGCQTPLVEVLVFICWALIPYYICDGVAWSGIVAIVGAGIMMDLFVVGTEKKDEMNDETDLHSNETASLNMPDMHETISSSAPNNETTMQRIFSRKGHLSDTARTHVHFVSEINSTMMETAIFAYLGLFLLSSRYKWDLHLTAIAVISCLVSRAIMIPSLSFIINKLSVRKERGGKSGLSRCLQPCCIRDASNDADTAGEENGIVDRRMQIVLWFGGLRGAMSFALVENIPLYDTVTGHGSKIKPELKAMTSASIIFSVFICGGTTYYLIRYLGLSLRKDDEMIEMTSPLISLGRDGSGTNAEEPSKAVDKVPPPFHSFDAVNYTPRLNRPGLKTKQSPFVGSDNDSEDGIEQQHVRHRVMTTPVRKKLGMNGSP